MRRTADEIAKMRRAGRVVAEMHEATRAAAKPGVTTADLDVVAREVLERRGARSNFLHYRGFPAVICTSPNDMIVHGIPGEYTLREGDILSIDCGAIIEGYHGDAAFTMAIGEVPEPTRRLIEVTEQSLWAGIDQLRAGTRLHEVGRAVQTVAEKAGFSVVREYVGHAIGTAMHEEPQVPNYWPGTGGPMLKAGMVFAVEPMVNAGGPETRVLDDGWSVVTADGRLSAHFEHSIAVTENGPQYVPLASSSASVSLRIARTAVRGWASSCWARWQSRHSGKRPARCLRWGRGWRSRTLPAPMPNTSLSPRTFHQNPRTPCVMASLWQRAFDGDVLLCMF